MTDDEISEKSRRRLSVWEVQALSTCHRWDDIPVSKMRAFLDGCRIDFLDGRKMNCIEVYMGGKPGGKIPNFTWLRKDSSWESRWKPMMVRLVECGVLQSALNPRKEIIDEDKKPNRGD